MIIILTTNIEFLPEKYQKSDFPKIINAISTLKNLEITKDILSDTYLYNAYIKQFSSNLNEYPKSIIIVNKDFPLSEITEKYHLIEIKNQINLDELEAKINGNFSN